MKWFQVEKVKKNPSKKKEPEGKLIGEIDYYVIDKADIPLYKMLNYDSLIEFYDMGNYFLARQYMIDRSTANKSLYAEYHLTLTDEAWKIIDALLSRPFTCEVQLIYGLDKTSYKCRTRHPVYLPDLFTNELDEGTWIIGADVSPFPCVGEYPETNIPFNCGPLRPLWKQAVECWIEKIESTLRESKSEYQYLRDFIAKYVPYTIDALLRYQYLDPSIVPKYPLTY
ncbi:MAG: hypothetical protein QXS96_04775 [Candidatus Caldarchaeum sp.]